MEKVTTIEGLAIMVAKGFDGVDKRFKEVDKRFDNLEERMNDGFDHVHARLSSIERDVAEIRKSLISRNEFEDILGRISYIERKLGIISGAQ